MVNSNDLAGRHTGGSTAGTVPVLNCVVFTQSELEENAVDSNAGAVPEDVIDPVSPST